MNYLELGLLELGLRLFRLPFLIGLSIAGYLTIYFKLPAGWERTFWFWMLIPFALATVGLECLQISQLRYPKIAKSK